MKYYVIVFCLLAGINSIYAQESITNTFSSSDLSSWVFDETSNVMVANGQMDATVNVSGYDAFEFTFAAIDISENPIVAIKVNTQSAFAMRMDLGDNQGRYSNQSPRVTTITTGGLKEYVFDFNGYLGQSYPTTDNVDASKINRVTFFFNAGNSFSGQVQFDDLIIGVGGVAAKVLDQSIRINQIGYELSGAKKAIKEANTNLTGLSDFEIINQNNQVVYTGNVQSVQEVDGWTGRYFWQLDFSDFQEEGFYRVLLNDQVSYEFEISSNIYFEKTASSVVDFFTAMRNTDERDRDLPLHGSTGKVNVYGGWSDATGDPGKHLSHLSYANYFNPQQIPMVVWSLLKSNDLAKVSFSSKAADLLTEATWGADYLVRQLSPQGFFYLAIFDDWGGSTLREVCEWGQDGADNGRTSNYQSALREGGGMAIAALARAYQMNLSEGDYTPATYLQTAVTGYAHLMSTGTNGGTKSKDYCNDLQENIIDDYCGLLAATELYKATNESVYLEDALTFADRLLAKQQAQGWLASDVAANRPFYHAADEGLPVLALLELKKITNLRDTEVDLFLRDLMNWYEALSYEVANPFDYTREYYKPFKVDLQTAKKSFFLPHDNETGYWWQGENARLASLTTAYLLAARELDYRFVLGTDSISTLALSHLDWIMGKNPFNVCMVYGFGHKTYNSYLNGAKMENVVGGICNGITSMDSDEKNIDWAPYNDGGIDGWQNWRWIEQWLPHDAWYLLAISSIDFTLRPVDCIGIENGDAFVDDCDSCVGGTTGLLPCVIASTDEKINNANFWVYPNPSQQYLELDFVNQLDDWGIFDIYGVKKMTGKNQHVDISELKSGTYFLKYQGKASSFIKQ